MAFAAVAPVQTLTDTTTSLRLSQSAPSRGNSGLESHRESMLFVRGRTGVSLTESEHTELFRELRVAHVISQAIQNRIQTDLPHSSPGFQDPNELGGHWVLVVLPTPPAMDRPDALWKGAG